MSRYLKFSMIRPFWHLCASCRWHRPVPIRLCWRRRLLRPRLCYGPKALVRFRLRMGLWLRLRPCGPVPAGKIINLTPK